MSEEQSGKYDDLAVALQTGFQADAAMVLLIGGQRGFGCSIKTKPEFGHALIESLRDIANKLEREIVMQSAIKNNGKEDN